MSLLETAIKSLGKIDTDTSALLLRFIIRATKSGNANAYIKRTIQRILDEEDGKTTASPVRSNPSLRSR